MRRILIYVFFTLALVGVGVAAFALFQPNPSGDFITGMAHLFISMMGAGGALLAAVVAAVLLFTTLKIRWVLLGLAVLAGLAFAALQLI